jgi:hypothetical protein
VLWPDRGHRLGFCSFPGFQPTDAALATEALMIVRSMLALLLGIVMSEAEIQAFSAVRDLVQEALPDEARSPIL